MTIIASNLFVQSQIKDNTKIGLKVGYNNSIINGVESGGDKTGYVGNELYFGAFVSRIINEKVNLQLELIYSYTEDYNFLELPLNVKYQLYNKWNLFIGPKIDFIVDEKESEYYKFNKLGISGDLGLQYSFTTQFFIETRYSKSFSEQITDFQLDINRGKRNTFRIGIGYRF